MFTAIGSNNDEITFMMVASTGSTRVVKRVGPYPQTQLLVVNWSLLILILNDSTSQRKRIAKKMDKIATRPAAVAMMP